MFQADQILMDNPALVFPLPTLPMACVPLEKRLRESSKMQKMIEVARAWLAGNFMKRQWVNAMVVVSAL
jgi:hypothetical protein